MILNRALLTLAALAALACACSDSSNNDATPNAAACPAGGTDSDSDGVLDACDVCPMEPDPGQEDSDSDGVGDACDNCAMIENADQMNSDSDAFGDACDNCVAVENPDQANSDTDAFGDACDNCAMIENADQMNSDADEFGDACDNCPTDDDPNQADDDEDSVGNICDNCTQLANPDQANIDGDPSGDACDSCFPGGPQKDAVSYPATAFSDELDTSTSTSGDVYTDVEVADFDNDGFDDFVVVDDSLNSKISVYRSRGSSSDFEADYMTRSSSPGPEIAVGDFNGDGFPDLANISSNDVVVYLNIETAGARAFSDAAASKFVLPVPNPIELVAGDFDGDGVDDLVIVNSEFISIAFGDAETALARDEDGGIAGALLDVPAGLLLESPNQGENQSSWIDVGNLDAEPGLDIALRDGATVVLLHGIKRTTEEGALKVTNASKIFETGTGGVSVSAPTEFLSVASIDQNSIDDVFLLNPGVPGTVDPSVIVLRNDGQGNLSEYARLVINGTMLFAGPLTVDGKAGFLTGARIQRHSFTSATYATGDVTNFDKSALLSANGAALGFFSDSPIPSLVLIGANNSNRGAIGVLDPDCI